MDVAKRIRRLEAWSKSFQDHIRAHLCFWIMVLFAGFVFIGVAQVYHAWSQFPPPIVGWYLWLGYWFYIVSLVTFYLVSVFIVVPWRDPPADDQKVVPRRVAPDLRTVAAWRHPLLLVSRLIDKPVDLLDRLVEDWPKLAARLGVVLLAMGAFIVLRGAHGDGSRWYPLAGALCQTTGVMGLLAGGWLVGSVICLHVNNRQRLGPVQRAQGRVLAWLIGTYLFGELIWFLAANDPTNRVVSFRLYTVWAAFELLAILVMAGSLVDYWHRLTPWPIRQLAILAIPIALLTMGPKQARDIPAKSAAQDADAAANARAPATDWFEHLRARIQSIPKDEPVIFVAASGGGSRAAIFTSLALETLAHTPLPTSGARPRYLSDDIALVSSVSGGSLATAYFVRRGGSRGAAMRESQNTTRAELVRRMSELLDGLKSSEERAQGLTTNLNLALSERAELLRLVDQDPLNADEREARLNELNVTAARFKAERFCKAAGQGKVDDLVAKDPRYSIYRMALESAYVDEMCCDFMAPILRGMLTPGLARGDSLAKFWEERFQWKQCTNIDGYGAPFDPAIDPVVLFNVTEEAHGARMVVGFPPLPADFLPLATPDGGVPGPRALADVFDERDCVVPLARAVQWSANFPWGFQVVDLRLRGKAPVSDSGVAAPDAPTVSLRLLDGGVVDNTGLDTIYAITEALANDPRGKEVMNELRDRIVIVFEVDSGAKPSRDAPSPLLAGAVEPITALNNAAFNNADRAKAFYVSQMRRQIQSRLEVDAARRPGEPLPVVKVRIAEAQDKMPETTFHVTFQCNHVHWGSDGGPADDSGAQGADQDDERRDSADQDVMTAWTLGPVDKARVLVRFMIELGVWQDNMPTLYDGARQSLAQVAQLRREVSEPFGFPPRLAGRDGNRPDGGFRFPVAPPGAAPSVSADRMISGGAAPPAGFAPPAASGYPGGSAPPIGGSALPDLAQGRGAPPPLATSADRGAPTSLGPGAPINPRIAPRAQGSISSGDFSPENFRGSLATPGAAPPDMAHGETLQHHLDAAAKATKRYFQKRAATKRP